MNHDFQVQGVPLSGMSLFRNFPKAWVLSFAGFWCLAHDLNYLNAVNGVSLHRAHNLDIEFWSTILAPMT
jgi:hypothetical protein